MIFGNFKRNETIKCFHVERFYSQNTDAWDMFNDRVLFFKVIQFSCPFLLGMVNIFVLVGDIRDRNALWIEFFVNLLFIELKE